MRLPNEVKRALKNLIFDFEAYHSQYDDFVEERLRELDPEYLKDLETIRDKHGVQFHCA